MPSGWCGAHGGTEEEGLAVGQFAEQILVLGPAAGQFLVGRVSVVGVIEAGGYGTAQQGNSSPVEEAGPLTGACRYQVLNALPVGEIMAQYGDFGAAVGIELQHFYRIAEIKVEDFVVGQDVHRGKGFRF